jgi:RNA polymerase sigma-70 factor (ECF subfamily)
MIEDEVLKWKFRRGNREALARIYAKYVNTLLSLALGLLNDPHEAEDVVQDVFVSLARNGHSLDVKGSLKAYLAKSVVNRVRDRARSQRSRQRRMEQCGTYPAEADRSDQPLIYNERCARLSAALAELRYEQREAVVLKTKHEMRLRDIARLQGVSVSTAHGRYRYGMKKLRALLNGEIEP